MVWPTLGSRTAKEQNRPQDDVVSKTIGVDTVELVNGCFCKLLLESNVSRKSLVRWLGSRVVYSVLDSGAEGPGFKSQSHLIITLFEKKLTAVPCAPKLN